MIALYRGREVYWRWQGKRWWEALGRVLGRTGQVGERRGWCVEVHKPRCSYRRESVDGLEEVSIMPRPLARARLKRRCR